MKKLSLILAMLLCSASIFAADPTPPPADPGMMDGKMWCQKHHVSPKDCKAQMEKWKNATPAEKQAMMKDRWSKMSPEERKMAMDRMTMMFNSMDADSQKAAMAMMKNSMSN
jgi:Skp family chaperone for outer membrane proteins